MIIGIGVDLVDTKRIEAIIFRWEDRFLKRLFTSGEIRYCNAKKNPVVRFATRYAAKHAFVKALFPKGMLAINYREIEIVQKEDRPYVKMEGTVKRRAEEMGVKNIHLMVSQDGNYAIANVVLEG